VVVAVDMVTTAVVVVDIAIRGVVVVVVGIIMKGKDASANESTAIGDATVVVDIVIGDVAVVVGIITKGKASVAMAQAVFFATLGNKLCKITKIFEELDPIKSQGVLCLELAEDPLAFDGI